MRKRFVGTAGADGLGFVKVTATGKSSPVGEEGSGGGR